jgi:UDP-N-acetylglucosamine pyrophosphorylase
VRLSFACGVVINVYISSFSLALKRVMETEGLELDIIINPKVNDDGHAVIQLETAAGAAIKHFKNAHGVNVPRNRFLPVKSCSDLLLIKSDIYSLQHGQLVINPQRMFETTPVIKLGDHFKKIQQFQKRFKKIPKIIELDHLTVTGDVYFGRNVTLRGTVIGECYSAKEGYLRLTILSSRGQRRPEHPHSRRMHPRKQVAVW